MRDHRDESPYNLTPEAIPETRRSVSRSQNAISETRRSVSRSQKRIPRVEPPRGSSQKRAIREGSLCKLTWTTTTVPHLASDCA